MSQIHEESRILDQIMITFNGLYGESLNTVLVGGAEEPLYQPASPAHEMNTIYFTRDYPASALHEIAHWCIAGAERRRQLDYGYWYEPDGRDHHQQQQFEKVEVRPQAIEWMLSRSCRLPFRLSSDNLDSSATPSEAFKINVCKQAQRFCQSGLPQNAKQLLGAFNSVFSTESVLNPEAYTAEKLNW